MQVHVSNVGILAYMLIIIYGTHYIRTWSYNRYEAVTFEGSAVSFLISILLIWRYGFEWHAVSISVILLIMFIANTYSQWFFYMRLQEIILEAFKSRIDYLKKRNMESLVSENLLTMASVAIMPSFSRFIEESKLFNNPGSFIGLIKSIMKRQRFQKKKYMMRESFAECINLIGPCKPGIEKMMNDKKYVIPAAIHANELALDNKSEIRGLILFDSFGFGAMAIIFLFICSIRTDYQKSVISKSAPFIISVILMMLSVLVFVFLVHILRHFAFARYEVIGYELCFSCLIVSSFRIIESLMIGYITIYSIVALIVLIILFMLSSFINHRSDKKLHENINKKFDDIIYLIPLEKETYRVSRRILRSLKIICEWAIVPFPGKSKSSMVFSKIGFTEKLKRFEEINKKKQEMPQLLLEFVFEIVSDYRIKTSVESFKLSSKAIRYNKLLVNVSGLISILVVFVCMLKGWL